MTYTDQFTPAKRAVEGDMAALFSPVRFVQSCLAMPSDTKNSSKVALFDNRNSMANILFTRGFVMSIEPTEEVIRQAKLQQQIDDINAATLGIRFNQLFKKK